MKICGCSVHQGLANMVTLVQYFTERNLLTFSIVHADWTMLLRSIRLSFTAVVKIHSATNDYCLPFGSLASLILFLASKISVSPFG